MVHVYAHNCVCPIRKPFFSSNGNWRVAFWLLPFTFGNLAFVYVLLENWLKVLCLSASLVEAWQVVMA